MRLFEVILRGCVKLPDLLLGIVLGRTIGVVIRVVTIINVNIVVYMWCIYFPFCE